MSTEIKAMIRELEVEDLCALLERLTQWFEKMESVFHISNCTIKCQTVGHDAVYEMPWRILMKMMTDKYCPRSEIKKLEIELWNLKVKESDQVEKYVGGLPDNIQGNVMSARPKPMQEAIELTNDLMDQKPPFKWQNVARAYTVGHGEKKVYAGTLPLCNKSNYHHNRLCAAKCANCKRAGHLTRDYKSPAAANNQRTLTCFDCGNQGHYRSDCPELRNRNNGNQSGNGEACGRVYALGGGETDPDPSNIEDDSDA
ncbi:hypothetical protein Tco_0089351 [Tanacetum coccineum]